MMPLQITDDRPGGNEKTGKYYGTDYDALNVNIANDGKRCVETKCKNC